MTEPFDVAGASPWQTRSSLVLYDNGFVRLREDQVIQPDGTPGRYAYLEVPWPIVAVVPVSEDGQVYLVRQWRYAWQRNSWEVPAGRCEVDEEPLAGAQRELAEEVGLEAHSWEALGTGYTSATIAARYHLYLARDLVPRPGGPRLDPGEDDLVATRVPLSDAVEAAIDGRIVHFFSVAALLRAARRLGLVV